MTDLLSDEELFAIEELRERRVLVLTRKATRPETAQALFAGFRRAMCATRPDHDSYGLVLDARAAPGNNTPEFERTLQRMRDILVARFPIVVIVVHTAIGQLQADRLNRERGLMTHIAQDRETAIRLAAYPAPKRGSSRPPRPLSRPTGDRAAYTAPHSSDGSET